ncbi:3-deoxy-8-phosphooctulonate synthase [Candidatus Desantisbacteria bacterium CG2_30_40_21]|uniref:2-dehydro-3-deoxyphosphooctonate aldolase n=5 Tax=unclassified Candidatus Desantisiibacteriota TaxID=3106372 RepID=A0A2M7JBK6_9BACT|nr:MAG: 3-deoxy-8-phosphooctulonate synthase [Candidatus Desantisbacteria bacterium CG2_30_40_21]PIP40710.1 MAG: 3-deoxy-8-phosphooctulonate synthase [Candidatus Desantisbacteria bacterium CG23_combo_of_CG06-09_8_20_14_all_40_23]PIX16802.1 MAG: 3-deoxy-8-phosphooctulonate synthase [Candidatus Desantisbacteria bacterium CG_4_8_14_3_um_filter_40_12]PIY19783.1 MAG: 3-deoxy-8-phosphooctulonate synthase [Candidatus Desantisbacteria bacterium CG_4_10_14_3_um_filter_40_18]PJB28754.1 MAG: 3-deoxy-8-pho
MREKTKEIQIGQIKIGGDNPMFLIAGPCVIESEGMCFETAKRLLEITSSFSISFIFKASYDKANRMSVASYRGPGIKEGLRILDAIKKELNIPILTDVHSVDEIDEVAQVVDILQIPALLCRQTDLIMKAASTNKVINLKKGQFMAPWDMLNLVEKVTSTGNENLILTERGTTFGYNNLVVDFRSIPTMQATGYPVVLDATHSVQLPGGAGNCSSGQAEFVPYLAKAGAACGCNGLFMEIHPNPKKALCDGANMLSIDELPALLKVIKGIDGLICR